MSRPRKPPKIEPPRYDNEAVSFERSVFRRDLEKLTPALPPRQAPQLSDPTRTRDSRPEGAVGRPPTQASPSERRYLDSKRRKRAREEAQQRANPLKNVEPQLFWEVKKGTRT